MAPGPNMKWYSDGRTSPIDYPFVIPYPVSAIRKRIQKSEKEKAGRHFARPK